MQAMAAAGCASLVLALLLTCCCSAAADAKLTHLRFYFHEIDVSTPKAPANIVTVVSLNKGATAFGDARVFDTELREGPDPASRLIGRARGLGVNASLDGSSIFSAFDIVFSGDYGEYSGSTLSVQGQFNIGAPSERTIVGGTGKLRFARGYMETRVLSSTNITILAVFDVYFTLPH